MTQEDRPSRSVRFQLVMAVIYLGAGLFVFLLRDDLYKYFNVRPEVVLMFTIVTLGTGTAFILMLYLRGAITLPFEEWFLKRPRPTDERDTARRISPEPAISHLGTEVAKTQIDAATGDREGLLTALRSHVAHDLATELQQRFAQQAVEAARLAEARQVLANTSSRLLQEIDSLGRRGNLNLTIGVLTTALAVGLLAYMVLTASGTFDGVTALLSHYVPRVTTVVFIEVFSFFFLRLYKTSLAEIKFYQNELTTLAAQQVALEAAQALADKKAAVLVLGHIARRNPNVAPVEQPSRVRGSKQIKGLTDVLERVSKLVADLAKGQDAK